MEDESLRELRRLTGQYEHLIYLAVKAGQISQLSGERLSIAQAMQEHMHLIHVHNALEFADLREGQRYAVDERITQEQCGYDGRVKSTTHHDFGYLIIVNRDEPVESIQEYRMDSRMRPVESTGVSEGFNFTKGFANFWLLFYPDNQSETNFRYLGQQASAGGNRYAVAFAERPDKAGIMGHAGAEGRSALLLYQGVAWIDAVTYRIVRMRLDLLEPRLDVGLERTTTDLQFGEIHLPQAAAPLWLPREVTVTSIYKGQMYRNRHLYFNFRLFNVKSVIKPATPAQPGPPNLNREP